MPGSYADVFLAHLPDWRSQDPSGAVVAEGLPPPTRRPGVDLITPTISVGQPWSQTIDDVVDELKRGQTIDRLFLGGHGKAGQFTVGRTLKHTDDATIKLFERLRPFTQEAITHAFIVGCEAAAEGPCIFGPLRHFDRERKAWRTDSLCMGPFTGDTTKPGYQLLWKLAAAIRAPVTGSPWKLAFSDGWRMGAAHLTVGPAGGWTYRAVGYQGRPFGSPPPPLPQPRPR